MGELTLKDLPENSGTAFMSMGIAMMTVTMDVLDELYQEGEVELAGDLDTTEDLNPGMRPIIYLGNRKGSILADSIKVQIPSPRPFTQAETDVQNDLRSFIEDLGYNCGPRFPAAVSSAAADTARQQSSAPNLAGVSKHGPQVDVDQAKTANDRFLEDRRKQLDELNRQAELQGMAAVKDETPPPDLTRGDAAVESARNGMLKKVDETLVSFDTTRKLFKKFSVDAELEKAFNSGLDAFAQYRKIRRKQTQK